MKFEFTGETRIHCGVKLHQIRALVAIGVLVAAGDVGGWIEREGNLSQTGDAWVYGDAQVSGDAWVSGDAQVYGNARVYGDAWVYGNARVYGNAQVSGYACVCGDASKTPLSLSGLTWHVTITDTQMQIGCQHHALAEWQQFDAATIAAMDGKTALRFWRAYKDLLLGLAKAEGRL